MSRIGDRVKEVREALGLKQGQVAKRSGSDDLKGNYLSRLESGAEENPGWKRLLEIADGLKVDVGVICSPIGSAIPGQLRRPGKTASNVNKGGKPIGSQEESRDGRSAVSPSPAETLTVAEFVRFILDLAAVEPAARARALADRSVSGTGAQKTRGRQTPD